jgi:hypothetical protein
MSCPHCRGSLICADCGCALNGAHRMGCTFMRGRYDVVKPEHCTGAAKVEVERRRREASQPFYIQRFLRS